MKRQRRLDAEELTARAIEHPHDEIGVEDVVVDGAVLDLVTRSLLERLSGEPLGNPIQVAQLDELVDVGRRRPRPSRAAKSASMCSRVVTGRL